MRIAFPVSKGGTIITIFIIAHLINRLLEGSDRAPSLMVRFRTSCHDSRPVLSEKSGRRLQAYWPFPSISYFPYEWKKGRACWRWIGHGWLSWPVPDQRACFSLLNGCHWSSRRLSRKCPWDSPGLEKAELLRDQRERPSKLLGAATFICNLSGTKMSFDCTLTMGPSGNWWPSATKENQEEEGPPKWPWWQKALPHRVSSQQTVPTDILSVSRSLSIWSWGIHPTPVETPKNSHKCLLSLCLC